MINFAICCVAFGDEHINEFNKLSNVLLNLNPELNIYVCTNDASKITNKSVNTIESNAKWNFNLKKESIREAFNKFDTILFMDTDMHVRKDVDFSLLNRLEENRMYLIRKPHTIFKYKEGEQISIYGMMQNTQYGKYIQSIVNPNRKLAFVEEQFFVLKLSNIEQRESFYNVWDMIYRDTINLNCHPNHIFEEGLNIFLSCLLSNIPINYTNPDILRLYGSFTHLNFDKNISETITLI